MDDYQTIMTACDSLPENSNILFDNKTYLISHTPIIEKSFQQNKMKKKNYFYISWLQHFYQCSKCGYWQYHSGSKS
jgi:hypothetical protein